MQDVGQRAYLLLQLGLHAIALLLEDQTHLLQRRQLVGLHIQQIPKELGPHMLLEVARQLLTDLPVGSALQRLHILAKEHHMDSGRYAEEIRLVGPTASLLHLDAGEAVRLHHLAELGALGVRKQRHVDGATKVNQTQRRQRTVHAGHTHQQKVIGLNVRMDDVVAMQVVHNIADLCREVHDQGFVHHLCGGLADLVVDVQQRAERRELGGYEAGIWRYNRRGNVHQAGQNLRLCDAFKHLKNIESSS